MSKMNFYQDEPWGRSFSASQHLLLTKQLEKDQMGITYEISDGRRVRLTMVDSQYHDAKLLKGKEFLHVGLIYDYGTFKNGSDKVYYIISENPDGDYIDQSVIEEFLRIYRTCWFVKYLPFRIHNPSYNDLEDVYRKPDEKAIQEVRELMKLEKCSEPELFLKMYDELCLGYQEALSIVPRVVSLSEINLGFTSEGMFKLFIA